MQVTKDLIRVGVNGAAGRMGTAVCAAVTAAEGLELVAAVDPHGVGEQRNGVAVEVHLQTFAETDCAVVVDFSVAAAARVTLPWLGLHGIHAVVGTTGLMTADLEEVRLAFGDVANCLIAPNFAISAVLMMRFAELAAPLFDTAEIIEFHHNAKIDAPSGTAITTAERMAAARGDVPWSSDPTEHEVFPGARGGEGPSGIRVHGVRMQGMIAHQEVILGALGQSLTIRQDSYDRESFMPGVVLACRQIANHRGLTLGLDAILNL